MISYTAFAIVAIPARDLTKAGFDVFATGARWSGSTFEQEVSAIALRFPKTEEELATYLRTTEQTGFVAVDANRQGYAVEAKGEVEIRLGKWFACGCVDLKEGQLAFDLNGQNYTFERAAEAAVANAA